MHEPPPATPPSPDDTPVWRLPQRLHRFTGRRHDLDWLARTLAAGRRPDIVALTGVAGVGKTSLALEQAHRLAADTELTAWIPATDRATVVAALAGLGASSGMAAEDDDVEPAARRTLDQLARREPWLLIYDDATPEAVEGLLPTTGAGRVIITSRRDDWSMWATVRHLEPFTPADAVALLLHHSGDSSRDAAEYAESMATELGHLPLAVDLVTGYCRRFHVTLADYHTWWHGRGRSLMGPAGEATTGRNEIAARLSTERLATDAPATQLLQLLSMLAPGYVPQGLFTAHAQLLPAALGAVAADAVGWHSLLARLSDLGLIRVEPGRIWVHQLLQNEQRNSMPRAAATYWQHLRRHLWPVGGRVHCSADWPAASWASWGVRLLAAHFLPAAETRPGLWQWYGELAPHVERVLEHADREGAAEPGEAVRLCLAFTTYLRDVGSYGRAADLLSRALEQARQVLGNEHSMTLDLLNNLATVRLHLGEYEQAAGLLEEALRVSQRIHGDEHLETLALMHNVAAARSKLGDLTGAANLLTRVIEARRRLLGADHPHTLTSVDYLGVVRHLQGDLDAAADQHSSALAGRRRVLGDENPETLTSLGNLAWARSGQGDLDQAVALYLQTLDATRRILGDEHPETIALIHNLAVARARQGNHKAAAALHAEAIAASRRVLGDDHPDTRLYRTSLTYLDVHRTNADSVRRRTRSRRPDSHDEGG